MEINYIENVGLYKFVGVLNADSEEAAVEFAREAVPGFEPDGEVSDNGDRSFEVRFLND